MALVAELAPEHGRWHRAARVGLITALGAGVTAALQIGNPLGLTLLLNFALPEASFAPARGAVFLCCAAVLQLLGLALVGALINSPVVHVGVFILICFCTTYVIYAVPSLGRLCVWIQVPIVTAFYLAMFIPDELGWTAAQAFAGMAVAIAVLLLCNGVVRSQPAQSVLEDSIAAALERVRRKLAALIERALSDPPARGDGPLASERPIASRLSHHLALLEHVLASASSAAHKAALLADTTLAEAIRSETERLAAAVQRGGSSIPAAAAAELRALGAAVDRRLKRHASGLLRDGGGGAQGADAAVPQQRWGASAAQAPPEKINRDDDEAGLAPRAARLAVRHSAIAAIASPLARICELTAVDPMELAPGGSGAGAGAPPAVVRNFLVRFSARHTIALTAAFLIGLWDNNAALHAAIWLLMLGGPPSHGATVSKFTMRAIGASGALALAALGTIVVAPNFTSPAPYMAAIFAGTTLMTYIGEGGGILSYLGIGGTAFVIAYGGPGPRADVLGSVWSIWGISLGMIIRAVVSFVWRERPSRTLAEQFQAPLVAILELLDAGAGSANEQRRATAEMAAISGIARMLTVANDALLEPESAEIDPDQLVGALDTLRRLAFSVVNFGHAERQAGAALTSAVRNRIEAWLTSLRDQTDSGVVSPAPLRKMVAAAAAPALEARDADSARILWLVQTLERQLAAVSRH